MKKKKISSNIKSLKTKKLFGQKGGMAIATGAALGAVLGAGTAAAITNDNISRRLGHAVSGMRSMAADTIDHLSSTADTVSESSKKNLSRMENLKDKVKLRK